MTGRSTEVVRRRGAERTLGALLRRPTRRPEGAAAPFLVEDTGEGEAARSWTVGEWQRFCDDTVDWLRVAGVGPGGAVVTCLGNVPEALAVTFACWRLGVCVVPLAPGDHEDRCAAILNDAAPALAIWSGRERGFGAALKGSPVEARKASELATVGNSPAVRADRMHDVAGPDTPILRIYTSGTTGRPKAVTLTSDNLISELESLHAALQWPKETRLLTVLPINHVNGLIIGSVLPWTEGWEVRLCPTFDHRRFWSQAQAHGATATSVVPTILELLNRGDAPAASTLREVLCGAGPLRGQAAVDFERRTGVAVRHLYGLSEATAVTAMIPPVDRAVREPWYQEPPVPTIGAALPGIEMQVTAADGTSADAEQRGELWVRGRVVMKGYAEGDGLSTDVMSDGWLRTGDEGFWRAGPDDDPWYFVVGRLKELIIRGGVNVSPHEIDAAVSAIPGVRHGVSFGFPHRVMGEEVAAYVVLEPGAAAETIAAAIPTKLPWGMRPKVLMIGRGEPFTATGKARRLAVRDAMMPLLGPYEHRRFDEKESAALTHEVPAQFDIAVEDPGQDDLGQNG